MDKLKSWLPLSTVKKYQPLLVFSLLLLLSACSSRNPNSFYFKAGRWQMAPLNHQELSGDLSSIDANFPVFNRKPISYKSKIFLIAAGNDSANFLQEIVDQKKIWLDKGYTEDEIQCYYSYPTTSAYHSDAVQFDNLASDLIQFRSADIPNLGADIRKALSNKVDYLYLYISSHGLKPKFKSNSKINSLGNYFKDEFPYFGQHLIFFGQDPNGSSNTKMKLHAIKEGKDPNYLFLNSNYLASLFKSNPEVPKFIVIQGCYSGGFIDFKGIYSDLSKLPNTKILTASNSERPSFGCESGQETTFYGSAFNTNLQRSKAKRIPLTNWRDLHEKTIDTVHRLEDQLKIPENKRSLPQFHEN